MVSGKTLIIRPGLIVGPGDETDRFSYWPVRIDRGGEVLAPGDPSDPVQFIDARDLAEWTIRMAEQGETGIYNATGPAKELGVGEMLNGIKAALNSNATLTWVNTDFLEKQKVEPWSDMPVWVPPRGEAGGMGRISIKKALAQRSDLPAACRNGARHVEVVQITIAGTTSEAQSRPHAGARKGSSGRVAQRGKVT